MRITHTVLQIDLLTHAGFRFDVKQFLLTFMTLFKGKNPGTGKVYPEWGRPLFWLNISNKSILKQWIALNARADRRISLEVYPRIFSSFS